MAGVNQKGLLSLGTDGYRSKAQIGGEGYFWPMKVHSLFWETTGSARRQSKGGVGWVRESLGEVSGDWIMPLKELNLLRKATG